MMHVTDTVKAAQQTADPSATPQNEAPASSTAAPTPEPDRADDESSGATVPVLAGAGALAVAGAAGVFVVRRKRVRNGE